ncbi:MAG: heavy-metal-associated domain-containing protein [Rhodospirillaceae bacterium]|nr:heavy-metal-associated domain-containing protein [Rhodospirillaceae bacterium]
MSGTYKVNGMTCGGCAKSVSAAIQSISPESEVIVDLDGKTVFVNGASADLVRQAVEDAGFEFAGQA